MRRVKAVVIVAFAVTSVLCLTFGILQPPSYWNTDPKVQSEITRSIIAQDGTLAYVIRGYRGNLGRYPEELKDLIERPGEPDKSAKWRGPYVKNWDRLRDAWGRDLKYNCPGHHIKDAYDLWSVGEDGIDGTSDDITNWSKGD